MTAAKERGTKTETAVVKYLVAEGWKTAERRATRGKLDAGDVAGIPGVCIEIKGDRSNALGKWRTETIVEARNAKANFFMLVVRRDYKKTESWDAYIPAHFLMPELGGVIDLQEAAGWVHMELQLAVKVMRAVGQRFP